MPSHALRWSRWCLGFPRQVSSLTWKWEIHRWVGWNHHRWGRPALNLVVLRWFRLTKPGRNLSHMKAGFLEYEYIYIYVLYGVWINLTKKLVALFRSTLESLSLSPLAGSLWVTGTGPFRMNSAPEFKPLPHSLWLNSPLPPIWRCPIHGGTPKSSILFLDFPTEKPSSELEVPPWPWKPPRWWRL